MPIEINKLLQKLNLGRTRKPSTKTVFESPFTIASDGKVISPDYDLLHLEITKKLNQIPSAKITFRTRLTADNRADEMFYPGKRIRISGGYQGDLEELFEGKVVKFGIESSKGPRRVVLELQHDAISLTKGKKNRSFRNMKDSEIWESILRANQLIGEPVETVYTHEKMIQFGSTDWDFLLARAEANGRLIRMVRNRVEIFTPNPNREALLSLQNGPIIQESELELDAFSQVAEAAGVTWNPSSQEVEEEKSEEGNWDTSGKLSGKELAEVVNSGKINLIHGGNRAAEELKSQAENYLMRNRMAKVKGTFKFMGYPFVDSLGEYLTLASWGDVFDGKALISGISHHFSIDQGWSTQLTIGMPQPSFSDQKSSCADETEGRWSPPVRGLLIGKVIGLENDPQGAFRIAVSIPILESQDQEIWARIAHPDAGDQRGMIFYPEIGDEVVLGFLNEDPRDAVILGSLNSSANPSPLTPKDENFKKAIVTKSGMQLVFDEDEISIEIKTPGGNQISVNEREKIVMMSDQSGNRVKLDPNGIELYSPKSIQITSESEVKIQGTTIEIQAQANLKAEGSAGAELSSSGVTTVKGSLIQIN